MLREETTGGGSGSRAARPSVRQLVRQVADGFATNDLLTYASAIAFQTLWAIPPFVLFALGLIGFLQLDAVWTTNIAPQVAAGVSPPMFQVIDATVRFVLVSKQFFWVTIGLLLTVWEISSAVRACMGVLSRVYGAKERDLGGRMAVSLALAVAVGACVLGAVAVGRLTPLLVGPAPGAGLMVVEFLVQWTVVAALLLLAVGLLLRYGPQTHQPMPWVSFGAGLVVGCWILFSILFGLYLSYLADYTSIFGGLASVFIAMTYLYLSAVIFVVGAQVDAVLRHRVGDAEARAASGEGAELSAAG